MPLQNRLNPQPPELKAPWRTDARIELQMDARVFARDIVLPVADELDPQKAEMPKSLIDQMAAKGWFGITIPAEHGGMGLCVFEYCLVSEELARAWLSVGSILARGQGLGTQTIDDARRLELLHRSAKGKWIGAIALSEPTAGSDLAAVQTQAIREDDYWLLSGTKRWVGLSLAADFMEVLARTREPKQDEPRSAGLKPADSRTARHLSRRHNRARDGQDRLPRLAYLAPRTRWSTRPEGDRLTGLYGDEGADTDLGGFAAGQRGLNIAGVHTAARAVGVARAALEDSSAYLQEREQFGHPIGAFQALRFALADMAAEVGQARAFWQQVAHLLDQGDTARAKSAQVKLIATEMAVRVAGQAMQLHGGNVYPTEHEIERYWRDARLTTIFEGTSEIQRRIISDRMLPRT